MTNPISFQIPGGTPSFQQYIPSDAVLGASTMVDTNRLVSALATGSVKESLIQDGVSAGVLTIAKTGSTARTVTFPDAAITVARTDAAQTFTGLQTFATGVTLSGSNLTLNSGSKIVVDDTTDSSSITTGSIQTDGGLGVVKAAYIGTTLDVAGATTLHALETIDLGTGSHPTGAAKGSHLRLQPANAVGLSLGAVTYGSTAGTTFAVVTSGGTRASPSGTAASAAFIQNVGYGHDGTAITSAKISYTQQTISAWTGSDNSTEHVWAGTPIGSTSFTNWMYLRGGASEPSNSAALGIGGVPTTGNGLLQLASGSTKASGIAWGTDSFLYRIASNSIKTDGALTVAGTTDSTSTTTGTAIISGGAGIAKAVFIGGVLNTGQTISWPAGVPTAVQVAALLGVNNASGNDYRTIGAGYFSGATNIPCVFGYNQTNAAGFTQGDFVVGTRPVTTDTAPTIWLRVTAAGALTTTGSRIVAVLSVVTAAGTTVATSTDDVVVFTGTTTQAYTLPAAVTGRRLIIKNRSTGTVTINRAGSDTIDGGTSVSLAGAANASVTLIANSTDWVVV